MNGIPPGTQVERDVKWNMNSMGKGVKVFAEQW